MSFLAPSSFSFIYEGLVDRKYSSSASNSSGSSSAAQQLAAVQTQQSVIQPEVPSAQVDNVVSEVTEAEWTYDPNEPRYCLCNQVSYGDMVACDNDEVTSR